MILANKIVAEYFIDKKIKSLYRNHDKPSDEKLFKLKRFLDTIKVKFEFSKNLKNNELSKLIKSSKNNSYNPVKEMILRSQSKATYHYKNIGHFGLALKNYTHFTSPIRRYSDLIIHRNLSKNLFKEDIDYNFNISDSLCSHLLDQEKKGELLERTILEKACCLYLEKLKKNTFTGYVDGLTEFGLFIKAYELPFSGLVHLKDLTDDFYEFDTEKLCIIGRNNAKLFKIGLKVTFKIKKVNINKGQIALNRVNIVENKDD